MDYISKKALLEWLEQQPSQYKIIPTIESGRFDIPSPAEGEWKAISEIVQRENEDLRAAEGRYRKALERIVNFNRGEALVYVTQIKDIAREALSHIGEQKEDTEQ